MLGNHHSTTPPFHLEFNVCNDLPNWIMSVLSCFPFFQCKKGSTKTCMKSYDVFNSDPACHLCNVLACVSGLVLKSEGCRIAFWVGKPHSDNFLKYTPQVYSKFILFLFFKALKNLSWTNLFDFIVPRLKVQHLRRCGTALCRLQGLAPDGKACRFFSRPRKFRRWFSFITLHSGKVLVPSYL